MRYLKTYDQIKDALRSMADLVVSFDEMITTTAV